MKKLSRLLKPHHPTWVSNHDDEDEKICNYNETLWYSLEKHFPWNIEMLLKLDRPDSSIMIPFMFATTLTRKVSFIHWTKLMINWLTPPCVEKITTDNKMNEISSEMQIFIFLWPYLGRLVSIVSSIFAQITANHDDNFQMWRINLP